MNCFPALLSTVAALVGPAGDPGVGPCHCFSAAAPSGDHTVIRGMTISCQTWGWEWGTAGFGDELDRLADLGANWVAIHPYAAVSGEGMVGSRRHPLDPEAPPGYLTAPIAAAHARGLAFFVKPHLAYWGSPFAWRGEIGFEDEAARMRFWESYSKWIVDLARVTRAADGFCVGTELDRTLADEEQWRELIARVRAVTDARLTYAANWDHVEEVPFWDALDSIGVQAYFPLVEPGVAPTEDALREGWDRILRGLRELSRRTGKPVVFTELGFSDSPRAAERPWEDPDWRGPRAEALQQRCLAVSLQVLGEQTSWLRGAFLWKWFVGDAHHHDAGFYLDTPELRAVIAAAWRR